jgi:hypothetical protein
MNGARDELWATTIKMPSRKRRQIMGRIHHRRPPKKEKSSPAVLRLRAAVLRAFMKRISPGKTIVGCGRYIKSTISKTVR